MIGQHLEASRTVTNKSTPIHIPITYWYLSNICFSLIDHLTDSSFTIPIIKLTLIIIIAFFTETCMVFFVILREKKRLYSFTNMHYSSYIRGSGIEFYESYMQSRTIYVVPKEIAWKDNSNHIKYSKSPKIALQAFRNKTQLYHILHED